MFGPNNGNMGIGALGQTTTIFKRKYRWTLQIAFPCNNTVIPPSFVKVAARPSLTIQDTEINYLNAKTWIPGKASWETISVTYLDVSTTGTDTSSIYLLEWLCTIYQFYAVGGQTNLRTTQGGPQDYSGTGTLMLYDGCGNELETWTLNNMFPTSINFGELDYSSSDNCEIALTLRYSGVNYSSSCVNLLPTCCTTNCNTNTIANIAMQFANSI